jgi:hypothetical protein
VIVLAITCCGDHNGARIMITPNDVREIDGPVARAMERAEQRIDEALVRAKMNDHWPCCLLVIGEFAKVADALVAKYQKAGWKVSIVAPRDRSELPQLQFEKPSHDLLLR